MTYIPVYLSVGLAIILLTTGAGAARAQDLPELPADVRETLGVHADQPLDFELVAEGRPYEPTPERPAHFNVREVHMANIARGRWVFAFTFAVPYTFDNTSIILYVDADNNPETGRPGMGCEVTYGHTTGRPTQMFYLEEARRAEFPPPRIALVEGVLFISADIPLNQDEGRSRFRIMVLSEQAQPHEGRDSVRWQEVVGPGDSDREPLKSLAEMDDTVGFRVTQSMAYLWEMQADERNVIINSYQDCEFEGFEYFHSEYRWPALRRTAAEGTITATVPRAGRFYPGLVVYDGGGVENYELAVNDEVLGHFSAGEQNRRQRLFFAEQALDFAGGETITVRAASRTGSCIVEDIVLLAEAPPVLEPPREIENLEVGWDWHFGVMRATWITTWPALCALVHEGGRVEGEQTLQNHRAWLPDLEAGRRYSLHIEAQLPDGAILRSDEVSFTAGPPPLPQGAAARERTTLSVLTAGDPPPPGYPLTTGVPFDRGVLGDTAHLRLLDAAGRELPMQARALVRWPDHSVKVALIDTVMPAQGADEPFTLEYGHEVTRAPVAGGIEVSDNGEVITVTTPTLRMEFDRGASGLFTRMWHDPAGRFGPETLLTRDDRPVRVVLTDDEGRPFDTLGPPESVSVEEAGPLRTVLRLEGHHTGDAGELFTYRVRMTLYARVPAVGISYRWGNDYAGDEFALVRGIRLELPLAVGEDARVTLGSEEPVETVAAQAPRLEQLYDNRHTVGGQEGERAPGWMLLADDARQVGLVPRHFWQLYPKAVGVEDGTPYYDIAPMLAEDQYADAAALDVIKLHFYSQEGRYKFRQGMTKVHDAWLVLPAEGAPLDAAALQATAELVNRPPVLAASPEYYADSGVFGRFVTRTSGRAPRYDEVTDRVHDNYVRHREATKAYGMLNFGDQFGERRINWSNGEYDHHFSAAQMFLRGADIRWHHLMQEIARHDIDVDHCHYHTSPHLRGAKWIHAMGHTGRYFSQQFDPDKNEWVTERPEFPWLVGWGIPWGGVTPCHSWTEGSCQYHMLTGDPTAIETARMLNDRYAGQYLNHWDFNNGRDAGWLLIFTVATYRTTYDPYYLNAARLVIERVLERRTPGGGWERQMVPGHCYCEPRCRGACSFMQGVLSVGLREYHEEIGDERIAEAIVDNARFVIGDMWKDDAEGWSYTSCPDMKAGPGREPVMAPLVLFAWEASGDPEFLDIAIRSMNLGFEHLGSMAHVRWTPYIVTMLDRLDHERPGIVGGPQGATVMVRNEQRFPLELRVFARDGRPAPAEAAALTAPGMEPLRPDADGRLRVTNPASGGAYTLNIAPDSGPWQVTSNANRMVMGLGEGLELDIGDVPARLALAPTGPEATLRLRLEAAQGRVTAALFSPTGRPLGRGTAASLDLTAGVESEDIHELVVEGPARVRLTAEGCVPWTAGSPRRHFNASAPAVQVEGDRVVLPGQGRRVSLRAIVHDPEDDVASVRWELPDGGVVQGPELDWQPQEGTLFEVRVVAVDAEGNVGSAVVEIRLPPAELEREGAVTVRAADFSAQGGGEVLVTRRVGAAGPIITQWHANIGHWLEWKLEVPAAGDYLLFARYATDSEPTRRALTINGASPGAEHEDIEFPATGGFSIAVDNWRFQRLGPPVTLAAGEATVRLTNLAGGLAVDYLALVPADR